MAEHRYRVIPNQYGGYYVVDERGVRAPGPSGFNLHEKALQRAQQLNLSVSAASPRTQLSTPEEGTP